MNEDTIKQRIHEHYWLDNVNCVTTTLDILSEIFDIPLHQQLLDAAVGMHGAGGYRAQCGLVEGGLLFIGVIGRRRKLAEKDIVDLCRQYAGEFEQRFSSLSCRDLRPEGFGDHLPPHLCEPLSCRAVSFGVDFLEKNLVNRTD